VFVDGALVSRFRTFLWPGISTQASLTNTLFADSQISSGMEQTQRVDADRCQKFADTMCRVYHVHRVLSNTSLQRSAQHNLERECPIPTKRSTSPWATLACKLLRQTLRSSGTTDSRRR